MVRILVYFIQIQAFSESESRPRVSVSKIRHFTKSPIYLCFFLKLFLIIEKIFSSKFEMVFLGGAFAPRMQK